MASTAHTDPEQVKERYDSPEDLESKLDRLAEMVRRARHMVAFTGAGISTSAGIPDFRGPKGKWTREAQGLRPMRGVSTVSALPTPTHMSLLELQRRDILRYLISQNCDGLHRRSGFPASHISELHGNSNIEVCEDCGQSYQRDIACRRMSRGRDHFTGRFCTRPGCGGPLVEYTIDFGQNLPQVPLLLAEQHSRKSDLHLVLGSSLTVNPACGMPRLTAQTKGGLVIVNLQNTPLDNLAALRIYAKTDVVMTGLMQRLGIAIPSFHLQRRLIVGSKEHLSQPTDATASGGIAESPPCRELFIKAVDIHDPSLEMSQLKAVRWPAAQQLEKGLVKLSAVPVVIQWCGHYNEPELKLALNLESSSVRDVQVKYDLASRQWNVVADTAVSVAEGKSDSESTLSKLSSWLGGLVLGSAPELVRLQQEHGLKYCESHRQYVLDGYLKSQRFSQEQYQAYAVEEMKNARALQRTRLNAASPQDVPISTSSIKYREDRPPMVQQQPVRQIALPAQELAQQAQTRKEPIRRLPGEFRKVATPEQHEAMKAHAHSCPHQDCRAVWQGPWGPFIGGVDGRTHFDLTQCPQGSALNRAIGWDEQNPRV